MTGLKGVTPDRMGHCAKREGELRHQGHKIVRYAGMKIVRRAPQIVMGGGVPAGHDFFWNRPEGIKKPAARRPCRRFD